MGRWMGIAFGIIVLLVVGLLLFNSYRVSAANQAYRESRAAVKSKNYELALKLSSRAVKLHPTAQHWAGLASAHYRLNNNEEAIKACTQGLAQVEKEHAAPIHKGVLCGIRGQAFFVEGRYREAVNDLEECAKVFKESAAYNSLAWILATAPDPAVQDGKKAVKYATMACEKDEWTNASHLDTLAAAYARNGKYPDANKYQQQAILTESDPEKIQKYKQRLELYRSYTPYSENP